MSAKDVIEHCLLSLALPAANTPEGMLAPRMSIIEDVLDASQGADVVSTLLQLGEHPDAWLQKAASTLAAGSPITARLVLEQYQRGQKMSLAECFRMELDVSCRCGEYGEFQEGVRALLIDKDRQPKWAFSTAKEVPASLIDWFFSSPWPVQEHPLKHLGA
jgi:enoyl-CoA hydratase/carnithine racemase